ncbi:hypothetical protein [Streptomyces sp. NPDC014734]|uniref:hypothetical protein n=1 Tax=Streptomyces sp. NPDC014734 TaxID=3364886 RepID=UPI0036FBD321
MFIRAHTRTRARAHLRTATRTRTVATAAVVATALGTVLTGCAGVDTSQGPGGDVRYVTPSVNAAGADSAADVATAVKDAEEAARVDAAADAAVEAAGNRPEAVRDAFAGLQATLTETCTPGSADCAYVLGRVNDELARLEKSMKADVQGPGHFEEPLARIGSLRAALNGDTSTANLEKHRSELLGTRDRVNTWMQGHPEDYR